MPSRITTSNGVVEVVAMRYVVCKRCVELPAQTRFLHSATLASGYAQLAGWLLSHGGSVLDGGLPTISPKLPVSQHAISFPLEAPSKDEGI